MLKKIETKQTVAPKESKARIRNENKLFCKIRILMEKGGILHSWRRGI